MGGGHAIAYVQGTTSASPCGRSACCGQWGCSAGYSSLQEYPKPLAPAPRPYQAPTKPLLQPQPKPLPSPYESLSKAPTNPLSRPYHAPTTASTKPPSLDPHWEVRIMARAIENGGGGGVHLTQGAVIPPPPPSSGSSPVSGAMVVGPLITVQSPRSAPRAPSSLTDHRPTVVCSPQMAGPEPSTVSLAPACRRTILYDHPSPIDDPATSCSITVVQVGI